MGCLWELTSFALRAAGTRNQQSVPLAFVSQILVLLAPMWINAFVYMVMGRMIYFFIPSQQIIGIKGIKIAKIFVWLDIISFLTQVGGGVMIQLGGSPSSIMMGIHIYMGGIGFQEFCIFVFTFIAVLFLLTMRAHSQSQSRSAQFLGSSDKPTDYRRLLYVLFAVLALITVRIIFRMVEFASGVDPTKNPIPFHEVYFLALDAAPMFVARVLLNAVHPGTVLRGEDSEFPKGMSRQEKKEMKRVRKEEKRVVKGMKSGRGEIDEVTV